MNWIWIVLLLCCCQGNHDHRHEQQCECGCNNLIQPRGNHVHERSRCESEREYPRPPFAPEERDCGCRASEMEQDDCNI